ncbi:unnamed protein product [Schistosoma turkestanicum]|nr:unnamed protein product [Schistosoma turkestanicum]
MLKDLTIAKLTTILDTSYIPVLTNASGNLSQIALGNNIPLPIRQPQFAQVASLSTNTTLSPQPSTQHQQTQSNCTGTNENTCGQSDQQSTMQTSNTQSDPNSIPPDVTRNISTVGRRPGPPPPAPERRDSVPQKTIEKINQISAIESTSLSTQIQSEKNSLPTSLLLRDQSDSQGEEEEEEVSESLHNSQQSHPLAMGNYHWTEVTTFASSINLTTRGRSALSMANLCIDRDGSDLDKASDIEQNGLSALRRSHLLTSVSAYASDADNTEDDHHSICSQRSGTARSMSTICRHGHRQHHHHHHYRHVHNHNNRHHHQHHQNRARCLSAIDPYIIYNQNVDEPNNQNSITNHKQDSCQTDNQVNDHGTHWKSQTFRRLIMHNNQSLTLNSNRIVDPN